jgi:hypothetical protein
MTQPRFYNSHLQRFYPLSTWFDGAVHALIQGTDFEGSRQSLRAFLYRQADEFGYRLRTRALPEEGLLIQAYMPDGTSITP